MRGWSSRRVDFVSSLENLQVRPQPGVDTSAWKLRMAFWHQMERAEGAGDASGSVTANPTERVDLLPEWVRQRCTTCDSAAQGKASDI
jgi:hypothetical protein